jgi:hypothetical protein
MTIDRPDVVFGKILRASTRFDNAIATAAFVLLCLFHMASDAKATALFVFIYQDKIVISADSKVTLVGDPPPSVPRSRCKIIAAQRGAFFALAGQITADPQIGFDVYATIEKVLNQTKGTLIARAEAVKEAVSLELEREYSFLKTDDPEYYKFIVSNIPLKIAFAAWENSHPILFIDQWQLLPTGKFKYDRFFPGSVSDPSNIRGLGEYTGVDEYKRSRPKWRETNPVDLARDMVQTVIDSKNPLVGPPISVLTIDAEGAHWNHNGGCPEIPPTARSHQSKRQ